MECGGGDLSLGRFTLSRLPLPEDFQRRQGGRSFAYELWALRPGYSEFGVGPVAAKVIIGMVFGVGFGDGLEMYGEFLEIPTVENSLGKVDVREMVSRQVYQHRLLPGWRIVAQVV